MKFCSTCGGKLGADPFPLRCAACGYVHYKNPLPGVVVVQPVRAEHRLGVVGVRRNVHPSAGELALPGGFIEHEDWQRAACRELFDETNICAGEVSLIDVRSSACKGFLVVYALAPTLVEIELPPFRENEEVRERVIFWEPHELCFPTHTAILREFFERITTKG